MTAFPNVPGPEPPAVSNEKLPLVHEMVERHAQVAPNALAVVAGGERLSYGELNARANRLAHHLRGLGAAQERIVGVLLAHGPARIVALLAALKAGAAYLPLDPRLPVQRISLLLTDSNASAVVTDQHHSKLLVGHRAHIISLDGSDQAAIDGAPAGNPRVCGNSTQLALVLYTSGSTGVPKGVLLCHNSLARLYEAWHRVYRLDGMRVYLQTSAWSFAVFQADVIRALGCGGTLVLSNWDEVVIPRKLVALIEREGVQFAEFVPAVLRGLVRHLDETGQRLLSLRTVVVGADRWHVREHREAERLLRPSAQIIHAFGLTETTFDSTFFTSTQEPLAEYGLVPIGGTFPGVRAYIVDACFRPVIGGEPGELLVGGSGIARGYLNRPALTAERYLPDPFSGVPGARLFRTGDIASIMPDGNLKFLGRMDQQVKVRGFRVELGEVEATIAMHPGVCHVIVVAHTRPSGEAELVAYVVPRSAGAPGAEKPTATALRTYAAERLPAHMIPYAVVLLDQFPLSPNGKIDRRALPRL
jgi:amino acid adenylation domain-containing protein